MTDTPPIQSGSEEEGNKLPSSQRGAWTSFVKSLLSYNGDLSSLTAPPFILSPTSLVEYSQFWCEHPSLFIAPAKEKDPQLRIVAVLRWFIATLRSQYCSRSEKLGSEKKPLNPFLGEVFLGKWGSENDDTGETVLVSEQVSHHPPVTAYSILNEKHGVYLQGFNGQKATISATATISVKQIGHALLYLKEYNEYYLITLPPLHIEGLFVGAPFVELEKQTVIQCTNGYRANIDFFGRGYFSGKKNSFKAKIINTAKPKQVLYTVSGQWSGISKIKNEVDNSSNIGPEVFWNATQHPPHYLQIKDLEDQTDLESRKAWAKVAAAIRAGDYNLIHEEKSKIENDQRLLRKEEETEGKTWKRMFFTAGLEDNDPYNLLIDKAGLISDATNNNNTKPETVWRFSEKLYKEAPVKP